MLSRAKNLFGSTEFLGGALFLFSAAFPLFDDYAEVNFSVHMLQHVLIIVSGVMIAYPFARKRLAGRPRGGWLPVSSFAAVAGIIVYWHFPGPWDAALLHPLVHAVEHVSFLLAGMLIGSYVTLLTDIEKITALLAAFFAHMGYAVLLVGPWNIQVYGLYTLADQVTLGWILVLTGPFLLVGVAYIVAKNPEWLAGFSGGEKTSVKKETAFDKIRVPRWLVPSIVVALLVVSVGYGGTTAFALSTSSPSISHGSAIVYISESLVSWHYSPENITVVLGVNNTVTWVSHSIAYDTVTSRDGRFTSGPIAPGGTFEHTFTAPGVYDYYCEFHPWMVGSVTVVAAKS